MEYEEITSCAGKDNSFVQWFNEKMKCESTIVWKNNKKFHSVKSCVIEYNGQRIYICFFYKNDAGNNYKIYWSNFKGAENEKVKYILSYYSRNDQENRNGQGGPEEKFFFGDMSMDLLAKLKNAGEEGVDLYEYFDKEPMSLEEMKPLLEKAKKGESIDDWGNKGEPEIQEEAKAEPKEEPNEDSQTNEEVVKNNEQKNRELPHDFIISGPPGAGKSHFVDKCVIPKIIDPPEEAGTEKYNEFIESHCERILFSDAVYHETFFGGYRPVMKGGNIAYAFAPGPFCHILKKAYQNRDENFVLVIEEFNRGDAYDILGEVFQLLDRNKDTMISEYKVSLSDEAKKWFEEDDANGEGVKKEKIYLPDNLFIICTMNNADSGVRYIDTAMKRRFQMIFIDEDGKIHGAKKVNNEQYIPFDETDTELNDRILPGKESITLEQWEKWRERINEVISKSSTEDKLISRHFIDIPKDADKETKVIDGDQFIIKVLGYLYQNVFRGKEGEIGEIEGLAGITEDCRSIIGLLKKYHGSDKFSFNIDENE